MSATDVLIILLESKIVDKKGKKYIKNKKIGWCNVATIPVLIP